MTKIMHNSFPQSGLSYWETQAFLKDCELIVIGSGIVGLNAAISYKQKHPCAHVLVLEKGSLPSGASSKNAGFACFGSMSELLSDIKKADEKTVWQTVEMRIKGLEVLKKNLGEKLIEFKQWGGYELFDNAELFEYCASNMAYINKQIKPFTNERNTYSVENKYIKPFGFKGVKGLILNKKEGQINTGKMINALINLAREKGISILNGVNVNAIEDVMTHVELATNLGAIKAKRIIIATNGFASSLLKGEDVKPARAQVLITEPISNLKFKGTFHYDEGFYYFRNVENRILFGGGRNLDFKTETSTRLELNPLIQNKLDELLKTVIIPGVKYKVEQRWSGIMGVGSEKKPIIRKVSDNVVCAVRMGGMGVAIGSLVGKLAVKELNA